jgi:CDP-diacylglycerol--glycerol-3-phosphate 3-phosphatidyltransferase
VNLPNKITIARLLLTLVFVGATAQYNARSPQPEVLDVALLLFLLAACSDFIDGYLARKFDLVTQFGRVIDPLADKLLICAAFILFAGGNFVDRHGVNVTGISGWMVVVIVARELLVTALRGLHEGSGRDFSARLFGKVKMWAQSITAIAILLFAAHHEDWFSRWPLEAIRTTLVWITILSTVLSGIPYVLASRSVLKDA